MIELLARFTVLVCYLAMVIIAITIVFSYAWSTLIKIALSSFALLSGGLIVWELNQHSQGLILVLGYFSTVFLQIYGVACLLQRVERRLVNLHPKSGPVHSYQQSVAAFEDWWLRTKASYWQRLSGRKFELELARLFNAIGWEARATRASGDGGIDIEATINGAPVIVQCKAYNRPVSPNAARELYGTLVASKAQSAILASVSGFGPSVHEFVKHKPIMLIDLPWIVEKQQCLDFERMPLAIGRNELARRILRVNPRPSRRGRPRR